VAVAGVFVLIVFNPLAVVVKFVLVVALVWAVNLFNFMDGADGLAAGMSFIGFSSYAFAALQSGQSELAFVSLCIAAASLGFLLFNFHPAKIFLGDCGSIPLGFLAGVLGLIGWRFVVWPLWFPMLVFSPFIVDASVTLLRRLFEGEQIWKPHRSHYYQKLVLLGWGHRKTAIISYVVMAAVSVSSIVALRSPPAAQGLTVAVWLAVYAAFGVMIDRRFNQVPEKVR
jgi:UDP-N-acetylmuramyl pentapeptide phosphotransferase/UDP-N-acetylglucosamine-1-phosphate transferase